MKNQWKPAIFFSLGLILVLSGLQWVGGFRQDKSDPWFGPVLASDMAKPYQAYFIGTSRVAASIDPKAFDSVVAASGEPSFRSINLGMGYTKTTEYWFALQNLLAKKPKALENSYVFLEAPLGIGEFTKWTDDWIVSNGIAPLASYLQPRDLPRFLLSSKTPWENKFLISLQSLFGFKENISRLRYHSMDLLKRGLGHKEAPKTETHGKDVDLSTKGGIRTDAVGLEFVRSAAVAVAKEQMVNQEPWRDFDSTVLRDLVKLVQGAGGKVVFMNLPVSSIQAPPLSTPLRLEDRTLFQKRLQEWGCPLLETPLHFTDEDFPDYWHLRKSRAGEFSSYLAMEFLKNRP